MTELSQKGTNSAKVGTSPETGPPIVVFDLRRKLLAISVGGTAPFLAIIIAGYIVDQAYSWAPSLADTIPFFAIFPVGWLLVGTLIWKRQGHFELYEDFVRCSRGSMSDDIPYADLAVDRTGLRNGFVIALLSDKRQGPSAPKFRAPNFRIKSLNTTLHQLLDAKVASANLDSR